MAFCYACMMACGADSEYHPHAACLMFRASGDADEVRANLQAVEAHGAAAERARIRRELLEEIDDLSARVGEAWMVDEVQLRIRLDRICPEEE